MLMVYGRKSKSLTAEDRPGRIIIQYCPHSDAQRCELSDDEINVSSKAISRYWAIRSIRNLALRFRV